MPKAQVRVKSEMDEAIRTVRNLQDEIPGGADDAAKRIAQEWDKTGKKVMMKQGNVVTGTGLRNMRVTKLSDGKYGVVGPSYLSILDTGRPPGQFPDTNNPRFIAAARSYGMTRQQLAVSIARNGTEAYPWIDEATQKIRKNASNRVKIEMNKAVKESTNEL